MSNTSDATLKTDFTVVSCTVQIKANIDEAWSKIGNFADAGQFLNVVSKLVSGRGQIGSVRAVGDFILEVMVGTSSHSYTYAQTVGPMTPFAYHGCVALASSTSDPNGCELSYTLVYDQGPMDLARRSEEYERISARFLNASNAMKRYAEEGC